MELTINQRWVLNPDGRKSIISAKFADDKKFMRKHGLEITTPPMNGEHILEKPVIPVSINKPESKQNAQMGKELHDQLFGRDESEDDNDSLLNASGLSDLAEEVKPEQVKPKKSSK